MLPKAGATNPATPEASAAEQMRLRAADGYDLGAVLYASSDTRDARRAVVLHGGAGIQALRYKRFALYLSQRGIPVLTYDYRGIGMSRPRDLRRFHATIDDWAEYDCAGAIGWMRERFPGTELLGIAHSIGALLVGGAHNAGSQARLVLIGAHTGYYGDYRPLYRLPMAAVWHGVMPALTRVLGYFPAHRLGLGEDIPAGVALQWAARRTSDLRPTGSGSAHERTRMLLDRCAQLQRPATLISISDDAFATIASAKRLLSYYPNLQVQEHVVYSPAEAGVRRIGHFGLFGRAGAALWPRLVALLDAKPH
jgi:predicted alpha/beta hydrolase